MKHKNLYLRGSVFLVILRLFLMLPVNARWIINRPADCTGEVSANSKKNEPVCYTDTINNKYTTIEAALAAANDGSEHKVVVIPNTEAVVITKSCFISSGVELVLPYGTTDAPVVAFAGPVKTDNISLNSKPSTTVILDSGVSINILSGGTLTVNGQMGACDAGTSKTSGVTFGQYSEMNLSDNASINIQNGGTLNCWGLIREVNKNEDHLGKVSYSYTSGLNADSNNSVIDVQGTMNLPFTVYDWQGGTASACMVGGYDSDNKIGALDALRFSNIFPLEQFDCPNVFPGRKFTNGGSLNGNLSVYMSKEVTTFSEPLVGNEGLIKNSSGMIYWDFETDLAKSGQDTYLQMVNNHKSEISVGKGSASIGSLSVTLRGKEINTKNFFLRLGSQFSLKVNEGGKFSITNKIAVLPGCSFIVERGGECIFSTDTIAIASPSESGEFQYDQLFWHKRDYFCPYNGVAKILNYGVIGFGECCFGGTIKGIEPTNSPKSTYVELYLPSYRNNSYYHVEKCKNSYKYEK